jgi:hypothetical protein
MRKRKRKKTGKSESVASLWCRAEAAPVSKEIQPQMKPEEIPPPMKSTAPTDSIGPFLQDLEGQYVMFPFAPFCRW